MLRVEAPGYLPAVVELAPDRPYTGLMVPLVAHADLTGIVLQPDGQPAVGAEVTLAHVAQHVHLVGPHIVRDPDADHDPLRACARTDAAGRWSLPPDQGPFFLVVVHASGQALVPSAQLAAGHPLTLEPWAGLSLPQPRDGTRIDCQVQATAASGLVEQEPAPAQVENGRLVFTQLLPGRARVVPVPRALTSFNIARDQPLNNEEPTVEDPISINRQAAQAARRLIPTLGDPPVYLDLGLVAGQTQVSALAFDPREVHGRLLLTAAERDHIGPLAQAVLVWHTGDRLDYDRRLGRPWTGDVVASAAVQPDGSYRVPGVRPGRYVVTAGPPGGAPVILGGVTIPPGPPGDAWTVGPLDPVHGAVASDQAFRN
jgi:hypothetical protein